MSFSVNKKVKIAGVGVVDLLHKDSGMDSGMDSGKDSGRDSDPGNLHNFQSARNKTFVRIYYDET